MGKTATNLSVILGLITIAFGGFYLYTEYSESTSEFDANSQTMQNMLNNTQVFISHENTLAKVEIDLGFFEDARFNSLKGYTTPINESPIGRPNPFQDVDGQSNGVNQ